MKSPFGQFSKFDRRILAVAMALIFIFLPLLFLPEPVRRTKLTEQLGQVEKVENQVRLRPTEAYQWFNLNIWFQENIHHGDKIFTGSDSRAVVLLLSGEAVIVEPNSLMSFEIASSGEIQLNVRFGEVSAEGPTVKPKQTIRKNQRITIHKNSFQIVPMNAETEAEPAPQLTEIPLPLPLAPMAPPRQTSEIELKTTNSEQTQSAAAPRKRPYWVPLHISDFSVNRPSAEKRWKGESIKLKAQWKAVTDAKSYQVEILKKSEGKVSSMRKIVTTETEFEWNLPENGDFILQTKALITSSGRKPASIRDRESQKEFSVPALVALPRLSGLFPKHRQLLITSSNDILFIKWQKSQRFSLYVLQISKDSSFNEVDQEFLLPQNQLKDRLQLSEGQWHWRVKGLSDLGESPWSDVREFKLVYE